MSASDLRFRELYLELVDSTEMIRALLAGIQQDEAQIRPRSDSWSILETLCHLYDEERFDFRARLNSMLNHPSKEWEPIDPQGWVASRHYNERELPDMKRLFFAERSRSLDWLKGQENNNWNASHAASFGTITAADMFASWVAHDNLTIRQFVELRRARLERLSRPYSIDYAGEW